MTELQLPTADQVRKFARGAYRLAGSGDVLPVPLDLITAEMGLKKENLFDMSDPTMSEGMKRKLLKFKGIVLGALTKEKTLYVDESQQRPRGRFTQAHELGHEAMPWHRDAYFVDGATSLARDVKEDMEREANLFAAELVFGIDRFTDEADSFAPSLGVPLQLANKFGTSSQASLRRYAAQSRRPIALIGMGQHVRRAGQPHLPVWDTQCETSASFVEKYGLVSHLCGPRMNLADNPAIQTLAELTTSVYPTPLELRLDTRRGPNLFVAHLFFNRYSRFLLLHERRRVQLGQRIAVAPA